jgi:2-polyprenyl-3-methyl-5-hydroxy-6-metoxy-1,4-benzoquinol methylase
MPQLNLEMLPSLDYRIPFWQPLPTQKRNCPFCGKDSQLLFVRPDKLPVAQCDHCRCFYVAVKLPHETLQRFYDQYWKLTCYRQLTEEMAMYLIHSASNRYAKDHCIQKISALIDSWHSKRALDIGCGFGEKASIMKNLGASVTGLDISREAVDFMNERLSIPCYCSTVEDFQVSNNYFDIVTMFEFIEHPLNPLIALRSTLDKMKRGGLLAIVTPNGTAGEKWNSSGLDEWIGFRVDLEHMQYLHARTIDYIAHSLDCCVVHLEQFGFRALGDITATSHNKAKSNVFSFLRSYLKHVPGVRPLVYRIRDLQGKLRDTNRPSRDIGVYHLFVILQKTG